MVRHRLPSGIPRHRGKQCVGGLLARIWIFGECSVDRFYEVLRRVSDPAQPEIAVGVHNIGN